MFHARMHRFDPSPIIGQICIISENGAFVRETYEYKPNSVVSSKKNDWKLRV